MRTFAIMLSMVLGASVSNAQTSNLQQGAEVTVYHGGDILTMESASPQYAEALVVKGDEILFVGDKDSALKEAGDDPRMVDLDGKTMMPGMIDTHFHFTTAINLQGTDRVNPWEFEDVEAFLQHLKELAAETPEGEWAISMGYDKVLVPPYRDLTRVDLDKVSTKHPIFVAYLNGHWGSVNSAGLEALEITRDTPTDLVKKRSLRRLFSAG